MVIKLLKTLCSYVSPAIKFVTSVLPEYKTSGSACFDILLNESYTLEPNELHNFSTGLRAEIPKNYCVLVFLRSSVGQKKLVIPNSVGVIDSDYRGEIKVPLLNLSGAPLTLYEGQRIAQGLLVRSKQCRLLKVGNLSMTSRGCGGFGSTGV